MHNDEFVCTGCGLPIDIDREDWTVPNMKKDEIFHKRCLKPSHDQSLRPDVPSFGRFASGGRTYRRPSTLRWLLNPDSSGIPDDQ